MGRYIQRRIAIAVPLLLAITVLIFLLLQLTPGDPLDSYVPPDQPLPPAQREALRHQLGLDRPLVVRYLYWLRETAQGNLGYRAKTFEPVREAIAHRIGPTLLLMGTAMTIGITVGVTLGVVAAVRQYSLLDNLLTVLAFLGLSLPVYLAGLIGLYVFSLRVNWFPSGGFSTPGEPFSWGDRLHHLVLPASIIAVNYVASTMRYTRSAMLEVLGQDYVRTARAKGLGERVVVASHALRNALLPVVTIIGSYVPFLLGGAVFIESIFSWPGMGRLFLDGVESRDYPLIMGIALILAIVILTANLLTDIAYAVIDPRIRYE
ncbi:MAG: peptide/nickel transport system permease protein [Thermomicrobiales bacterium]|nr:peptide/nickel transport system permease protein [Thermomicrobiales bacterium]